MKSAAERNEEKRQVKLDLINQQIKAGTLVVRTLEQLQQSLERALA